MRSCYADFAIMVSCPIPRDREGKRLLRLIRRWQRKNLKAFRESAMEALRRG